VFNRRSTSTPVPSSTSTSSSEEPRKMRNLEELYDATQVIKDTTLFCFFADSEEMHAIEKNDTWKLTNLPENKKAIDVKWVYKMKKNAKGKVQRYKARLVIKCYKQRE
jgi:hypothetical protein